MKEFKYVITDAEGIHARPAGLLVKEVKKYQSDITLEKDGKGVPARKLMAIMALCIKNGAEVTIKAEGPDEDAAIAGLEEFFKNNL